MLSRLLILTISFFITGTSYSQIVADFIGSPRFGYAPMNVVFTDQSTNATSWTWSFPGGSPNSATGQGPHIIAYNSAGSFNVSLMVQGMTTHMIIDIETKQNYITMNVPELDFGDAPSPYPTIAADPGVMIRTILPSCKLGALIDGETDGQPDPNAVGDDNTGLDDEDGVTFHWLIQGKGQTFVTVDFSDPGLSAHNGLLNAWIDFDGDSIWEAEEKIFNSVILTRGEVHELYFSVPDSAVLGKTFARFVLTSARPWVPISGIPVGEVEDYEIEILSPYDYGDAPSPYPTRLSDPGSVHRTWSYQFRMGWGQTDGEPDGQPDIHALGDDNTDTDDEDGVVLETPWSGLLPLFDADAIIDFTTSSWDGLIDGWIDYDQNGIWENEEQILNSEVLAPGDIHTFTFEVPADAEPGTTFARFILTAQDPADTNFAGIPAGEVEDYEVFIEPNLDFGDAPAPYPTLRADPGVTFRASYPNMTLGFTVDSELDGQPDVDALGDDNDGSDDEDGVTINWLNAGEEGTAYISHPIIDGDTLYDGLLDAWIDFDQNGAWEEDEHVIDSYLVEPFTGTLGVTFDVPATAITGYTYGRFVLTDADSAEHHEGVFWGEVEDHQIQVLPSTGVNDEEKNIPSEFYLDQNYPNPFNSKTKIRFGVKEHCHVLLKVFNVLGEEVGTLVDEEFTAGSYDVDFITINLTSGIYFYTIQMNDFTDIQKMVVLE